MTRWEYLFRKSLTAFHRKLQGHEKRIFELERRLDRLNSRFVLELNSAHERAIMAESNSAKSFDRMITLMGRPVPYDR